MPPKGGSKTASTGTSSKGAAKPNTGTRKSTGKKNPTSGSKPAAKGLTIGDTPSGKAIQALQKNTGKKGSFWSNKAIKDTAIAAERGKTQRTAFRSAAAASVATSYAKGMEGGIVYSSTANPTLDNSGEGEQDKESGKTVYKSGQGGKPLSEE